MRAVIVGNGPAAASAVKAFREVDRESSVVIISPERYPTYAPNCMENVIRDDILPEALFYTGGERFYERYRVELYLGKEAVRIDTKKKVVMTADGGEIPYDVCLLAAGAKPFIPPIEGIGLKGITTAKTLDDAIRIRKW
ncbi:MAG TPA: NAD(P)/FAD-dependent oxidoreductase, partial [Aquifex aeolicus]|nr:NAD(P)/FAD-dependent oxidoreductase [Aquifex aeolicus]